ncbi:MAG: Rieske 2Fe-2S domain-containing protein [Segetibacter sp.]|nr:Rieske 2Fe-2S domain-containing protein [Segetibacter sp.]
MNRRKFITTGCISCMSGALMMSLIEGCSAAKVATATIEGSDMIVPLADFITKKSDRTSYKKYLVVQNEKLKYPICVFRFDENNYEALLMRCTHQGNELQVFGDKLQCPAHGSEFNNRGDVKHGPAATALRKFPVTITNNQLKISLI